MVEKVYLVRAYQCHEKAILSQIEKIIDKSKKDGPNQLGHPFRQVNNNFCVQLR